MRQGSSSTLDQLPAHRLHWTKREWPEFLTLPELRAYSRLSDRYLRQLINSGELMHLRVGEARRGRILVKRAWYDAWVDERARRCTAGRNQYRAWAREVVRRMAG